MVYLQRRGSDSSRVDQGYRPSRSRGAATPSSRHVAFRFEPLEQRVVLSAAALFPSHLVAHWSDDSAVVGDYSGDGRVDTVDYAVWREALATTPAPGQGADGTGDGKVTQVDFDLWLANFGSDTHGRRVQLAWDAMPGATSYLVKRSDSVGGPYVTVASGLTGTAFSDPSPLESGGHYVVSAMTANGESLQSNEATPPVVLQAEDAALSGVVAASTEAGYFGDGYAQFVSPSGATIEWDVDTAQEGEHRLTFRYALGDAASRPLEITVNGQTVNASAEFTTTGGWSSWQEVTVTTALAEGANTVRLTSIGSGGANIDRLTVEGVDPLETETSKLRRPVSPDQPMWIVHIDTWNNADPQKIIDLIPPDIRPFVVMNIALSVSHDAETGDWRRVDDGYETVNSWLRTVAQNGMWAMVQQSSGAYAHFSDYDLSVYEQLYREYPNLIGFNYAEQFWGFGDAATPPWQDRIQHFANLLELSHKYGGYLVVSWNGNQYSQEINPIAMLKRVPEFADASRDYTQNYLLFEKYTSVGYLQDTESLTLGAYLSGYSGNYGIRYDSTGWTGPDGDHGGDADWTLVTGAAPQLEHQLLTGQTLVDGPELIWQENFTETSNVAAGDGFLARNWDTFDQFDNVSIDLFRKVLDGTVRIPTREEVIDRTKVVVINDVDTGDVDTIYSSPETLFEGLYRQDADGNYEDNHSFFKKTGRYPTVPTVIDLDDQLAQTFQVQVDRSDFDTRWPTISSKVAEFNTLFPQEYTGDLYAGRHENAWVVYNPYKTGQTATGNIPFKYNTSDSMELTFSQYTSGVVREYTDSLTFYLNNYDNALDTSLKTDTIKIYGATTEPAWSFVDRADHQPSVVTSDWTGGVFTLTVQHNGALDITIDAAGSATNRLTDFTPATIVTPDAPLVYTGPLQYEAEHFDHKNTAGYVANAATDTPSVDNFTGQGYIRFGSSSAAAVRDTVTVLEAGDYKLQTRYSLAGPSVNSINLYVNGVNLGPQSFANTGSNSNWAVGEVTIPLVAGDNTIEFRAGALSLGSVYFDNIVVVPTTNSDGFLVQEGDAEFANLDGVVAASAAGFTGSGYADTTDVLGAGVNWALTLNSQRVKSFTFRYASLADRTADLVVDGVAVAADIQFPATGSLSEWRFATVYASVPSGDADVRLQSTSAAGLPNIDSLEVVGAEGWFSGQAPFTPGGVTAAPVSSTEIEVEWWSTPGADSYNVLRAATSGGPYTTIATGVTGTGFTHAGLSELETHHYVVTAVNAHGQSRPSSQASATTQATSTPAAPAGLNAVAVAHDQIDLTWDASPGADSYIVKRSISPGGPYTTIALGVTGASFTDGGLFPDTTYYYVVSGVNVNGEGSNSVEESGTTNATAYLAPVADAYVRGGANAGNNYGGELALQVKNEEREDFLRNALLSFDVSDLADAQSVVLQLTPFQVDDAGAVITYELLTDDGWTELAVTWNNQPTATGGVVASVGNYVVGQTKQIDVTSAATSEAAGDGILSLRLFFAAQGNNFTGFHSREAANVAQRPALVASLPHVSHPVPAAPTDLVATSTPAGGVELAWTEPAGATRYNIKRSTTSGGPYTLIAAGVQGASYTDSGLAEGVNYYYVVSVTNGTGESANSTEAAASLGDIFFESGGVICMEAEHGNLGSDWQTTANAAASGGVHIQVNPALNHTGSSPASTDPHSLVTYDFNVSAAGNYRFWFRTFAPSADDDSFFWRIDNGGWNLENGVVGNGDWFLRDNPQVDSLAGGDHVLKIAYRENGAGIDKFVIQQDGLSAPTGDGPPESNRGGGPPSTFPGFSPMNAYFGSPQPVVSNRLDATSTDAAHDGSTATQHDDSLLLLAITEGASLAPPLAGAPPMAAGALEGESARADDLDWLDELAVDVVQRCAFREEGP